MSAPRLRCAPRNAEDRIDRPVDISFHWLPRIIADFAREWPDARHILGPEAVVPTKVSRVPLTEGILANG